MNRIEELRGHGLSDKAHPAIIDFVVFLFFVFLAFTIYFPSINGPFIFDDLFNILYSPAVRMTEFSFMALKKAAVEGTMASRPVANISFALNYLAGGYDVTGYHAVNILLHAANGFLLYLFFRVTLQIIGGPGEKKNFTVLPLVAALLWFVHPLQSQAVAYVVQRMTSLAALFYLLAMLFYARGRLAGGMRPKVLLFGGSFLAGLLALASKEIAATLPLFIFLYEWYFFQDLKWEWLKKRGIYIAATVGSSLALALVFLGSQPITRILADYQIRHFTMGQRLLTELRVVVVYLGKILLPLPARLSLEHDIPLSSSLLSPLATLFSALVLVVLAVAAIRLARRERLLSFAIIWYLGHLLIESSVLGLEIIFEHRNYLPSMFLVLLLVVLGERFIRAEWAKWVLVGMVVVTLSLWSNERSRVWADEEILMRDCIKKAPNKFRMYYNLGAFLVKKGKLDEAIETFNQALVVYPKDYTARGVNVLYENLAKLYTNRGNALSGQGKYAEGSTSYYQALGIDPDDARAYLGLGNNSLQQGDYSGAEGHYHKALAITSEQVVRYQVQRGLELLLQERGAPQKP